MKIIAFLLFISALKIANASRIEYTVSFDKLVEVAYVTACFYETKPKFLESSLSSSHQFVRADAKDIEIVRKQLRIKKSLSQVDPCVNWQVDVKAYRQQNSSQGRWSHRISNGVVQLETGLILWRPKHYPDNTKFHLTVKKQQNKNISTPFLHTQTAETGQIFQLNQERSFMSLPIYLGDFHSHSVPIANTTADIAFLSPHSDEQQNKIVRWITLSLSAITTVTKNLPFEKIQVIVIDVARRESQATPFAMVFRGEGNNVTFYVNKHAPEEEFKNDWTAYHEFTHLLLPFIDRRDAWLSEGFASYYQYIIMGRAKVLSPNQTFNRLWGGIQRGKQNFSRTRQHSLLTATRQMRQLGAYRRVYWTGALVWLEAELELQRRGRSLEQLLQKFHACCNYKHTIWTAKELALEFDAMLERPLFTPLFESARESKTFPDYRALFQQLNLTIEKDGSLQFGPSPLRDALLAN